MSLTKMTTLAFILYELFSLDGLRCKFMSTPLLEYPVLYYHDTLQKMCRVQDCQLLFSYFPSYFPLKVSNAISCQLYNLKTLLYIIMILYSYDEQVMIMCLV